jgi:hypothetical protein
VNGTSSVRKGVQGSIAYDLGIGGEEALLERLSASLAGPSQTSLVVTIRQPLGLRLGPPCASTDPERSAGGCYLSRSVTPLPIDIANAGPVSTEASVSKAKIALVVRFDADAPTSCTPSTADSAQHPELRRDPAARTRAQCRRRTLAGATFGGQLQQIPSDPSRFRQWAR